MNFQLNPSNIEKPRGFYTPRDKLSESQKNDIAKEYDSDPKISCRGLARKYKVNRNTIRDLLMTRGIDIRPNHPKRYKINDKCFEKIDSAQSAYFLGLLYADGYNNEKKNSIILFLVYTDKNLIEKFKKFLGTTAPIKTAKPKIGRLQMGLIIVNKKISQDLSGLGCYQKKSLTLEFPSEKQVPDKLLRHFIRGYFDGDGSFYINKGTQNGVVSFCSSIMFLESLKEYLAKELSIVGSITKPKKGVNQNCRSLSFSGNKQCPIFLDWLYKDCNSDYLERKYQKVLAYKKFLSERTLKYLCKKVARYDIRTGELIETYGSLDKASIALKGNKHGRNYIAKCCKNKKPFYLGFKWGFV